MFTETPDLIQGLVQEGTGIHADVFKRVSAAYPYWVRLWDADTGNTLDVRLLQEPRRRDLLSRRSDVLPNAPNLPSRVKRGRHDGVYQKILLETTAPDLATEATWPPHRTRKPRRLFGWNVVAEFIAAGGGPEAREWLLRRLRTGGQSAPIDPELPRPAAAAE